MYVYLYIEQQKTWRERLDRSFARPLHFHALAGGRLRTQSYFDNATLRSKCVGCEFLFSARAIMDYAAGDLFCKSASTFVNVNDALVTGKAIEHSWRLGYRPQVGQLPLPVELQTARDLDCVNFSNVYRNKVEYLGVVPIKILEHDAALALEVANHVLDKLAAAPLSLHVLTCDHTGPSGAEAHDLLMAPSRMVDSTLKRGLYSVECVCRRLKHNLCRTMNWAEVLCADAIANIHREFEHRPSMWRGRILVLIQLGRGREDKLRFVESHALLLSKEDFRPESIVGEHKFAAGQWTHLWGWQGFDLSRLLRQGATASQIDPGDAATTPSVIEPIAETVAPVAQASVPELLAEDKWQILLTRVPAQATWIEMPAFLKQVGESALHPKRFLEFTFEGSEQLWCVHDRSAQINLDYSRMGRGGKYHGDAAFLKQVFLKYYASRYQP